MNIAIHTLNSIGCPILESDYAYYGGTIVRDKPPARGWEDCSSCRFFAPIHNRKTGRADTDFGVCLNQHGPRAGLFTFEHQAGFSCYQPDEDEAQANINPLAFAAIGNKPDENQALGRVAHGAVNISYRCTANMKATDLPILVSVEIQPASSSASSHTN